MQTDSTSSTSNLHHTTLDDPDPTSLPIPVMHEPSSNDSTTTPESSPNPTPLRKSSRVVTRPVYLEDFHCNNVIGIDSAISSNSVYPLSSVLSYNSCAPGYHAFCCSISAIVEPTTYNQASKFECWWNAMNAELLALDDNKTWYVVDLPHGKVPIGCK